MVGAVALAASPLLAASGQQVPSRAPSGRPLVACTGQVINDIVVYADAPSVSNLRRVPAVAAVARAVHATTRTELIRRFLLLDRGEPCSELRRAESERILRAQPFIAEAEVFVVANEGGGVDLEVQTSDEVAIVLGGTIRARAPNVTSLLLGNANLAGEGIYASGSWSDGEGFRDAIAMRLIDHQFLGRPWIVGVEGERGSLGGTWRMDAAHPFLTDLQRIAWRVRTGSSNGYAELQEPSGETPGVGLRRGYFDVGAIMRVGLPGSLNLFGLSLTGVDEQTGTRLIVADSGVLRDVGPTPVAYAPHRIVRANALIGKRDITFVRLTGLDALTASQDVPIGFQIGAMLGRSIPLPTAREDDVFLAGDLYVGATTGTSTARLQMQAEGRRGGPEHKWDGVITSGRLTHTWMIEPQHQNRVSLEWSGAFRERLPLQLQLGLPEGGVRGYEDSYFAGGQRLVARMEERYILPNALGTSDLGFAVFADAGKQWAGDAPFGVTVPVKGSVGISLLAAIPPRSARLWRADLAFPVTSGANARWTLRFTNGDRTAFIFRSPRDIADGREITAPTSIFAWP
jgi:hypothetical protein